MLDGRAVLMDARAPERYRGDTEPIDPRAGHIPGATSAPWADNLGPDGRFLSPDALRARYRALGAGDQPTVAYCGSGLSATHDLLALELAGITGGLLYEGSWSDWSSDPARPAAIGDDAMTETDAWDGWEDGADDRVGRKRDRLARLLSVASILYSKGSGETGVAVSEIARLTGMTTRTVYRDINALDEELGVPVFQAGRGRYGIDRKFFLPPLRLTVPEAIVLFLAARLIARWSDQYDAAVVSAFTKLADLLPQPIARHVAATMLAVGEHESNEPFTRSFAAVARGWAEGRVVELVYDPGTGTEKRTRVHPFFLEPDAALRSVYLIGWDEPAAAMRTYKVERIRSATVTQDRYEIPDDFDPDAWLANSWGIWSSDSTPTERVRLRFSADVAHRVREAVWHRSQELVELAGRRSGADRHGGGHRRDPSLDHVVGGRRRGARANRTSRRGGAGRSRRRRPL